MKNKQNIFGISEDMYQAFLELEDYAEENEGEIPDWLFAKLEITKEDLDNKLEAYSSIILQKKGEMEMLDEKIEDLNAKKRQRERHIANMENMLAEAAKRYGEKSDTGNYKLQGKFRNLSFIFSKPLVVDDATKVPANYKSWSIAIPKLTQEQAIQLETFVEKEIKTNYKLGESVEKTKIKKDMKDNPTLTVTGVHIDTTKGSIRFK